MLTYKLVQPSYAVLKLSSLCGVLQLEVDVATGHLELKKCAYYHVAQKIHQVLTVLKIIQLSVSLANFYNSEELSTQSVKNAVAVLLFTCLPIVALIWSREINKYGSDLVTLLNPLWISEDNSEDEIEISDGHRGNNWRKRVKEFLRGFKCLDLVSYFRAVMKDLVRHVYTFSIHDMLTIVVPFGIISILFVAYGCVIIGEPKEALTVSLLDPDENEITALWILATVFDLTVATFVAMTLQMGFYTLCVTLAIYTQQLKILEHRSIFETDNMRTSRNMEFIWKDIRRLVVVFNLFNSFGSVFFYAGKIMAFTCSVVGTFHMIRYGFSDLLSCAIALLAIQAIMFYVLCLGNAYKITDMMNNVLQNIKLLPQTGNLGISKRELRQRLKSTRAVALTEGGFRPMNRETTPEFIDFYVNQVIALVLAF